MTNQEIPDWASDVGLTPMIDTSTKGVLLHKIECTNNMQSGLNHGQTLNFTIPADAKFLQLDPHRCFFQSACCI